MRLADVMAKLTPVVGLSSLIGAPSSVRSRGASADEITLGGAREALEHAQAAQNASTSDYAYWGYQGQVSFWKAVVSLCEAAEITGPDNLPDVPPDFLDKNQVVMDACYSMEKWAESVLASAKNGGYQ